MQIHVKLTAHSKKSGYQGKLADGTLKIHVKAPAEQGKANAELIAFFKEWYKIDSKDIKILSGKSNSRKILHLPDSCLPH